MLKKLLQTALGIVIGYGLLWLGLRVLYFTFMLDRQKYEWPEAFMLIVLSVSLMFGALLGGVTLILSAWRKG